MDYSATISSGEKDQFDCDNCNAKLEVNYVTQSGHNEKEEYYCPECSKMHYTRASLPILQSNITLLSPRTDGKTEQFQNS